MCGISGYIGDNNAEKNLINCLKMLEYRGYDSAGIAVLSNLNDILVTKSAGKINNLEKKIHYATNSRCGIAHTRWATHGAPTDANAHPHVSNNKNWSIVHNGIIENYNVIKSNLKTKGYKFKSQTDTEVIANLLQDLDNGNPIECLINVANKLDGSYALACLNKNYKDTLFLAKNKSPLYIAYNKSEVFVASDAICFVNKAEQYYSLNDGEFCQADLKNIIFYDKNGKKIKKTPQILNNYQISNSKQNYDYFMEKEILEVPNVLKRLVETYKDNNAFNKFTKEFIKKFNNVVLIGCGTAYHAACMGAKYLQEYARLNAQAFIASEYRYSKPVIDKKTLCILVSQSGETADTLAVCEQAKENKATTIALTNVLYSTLAHKADIILPVCAGTEIAVASTKAYSAQISAFYMLSKHLENQIYGKTYNYFDDIINISNNLNIPSKLELKNIVDILTKNNINSNKISKAKKHVFFIGRNFDFITALEASLKLKEITYIFSAEHPAGELKHGFLALIDKSSILFAIATNKNLLDKTLNGAFEAHSRGAKVIFVTQFDLPSDAKNKFYKIIKLPSFKEELMPITTISYFQMLAYLTSIQKGLNPDQPRNLAKSVTVE